MIIRRYLKESYMDDKLIKKAFNAMKSETPTKGKCPDEADLCRFVEGLMDERETSEVEKHLISCPACCDYVVSFNKIMHFPEEEKLPEVPVEQIKQASKVCRIAEEEKERSQTVKISGLLDQGDLVVDGFDLPCAADEQVDVDITTFVGIGVTGHGGNEPRDIRRAARAAEPGAAGVLSCGFQWIRVEEPVTFHGNT